jgi:hypothetical protein
LGFVLVALGTTAGLVALRARRPDSNPYYQPQVVRDPLPAIVDPRVGSAYITVEEVADDESVIGVVVGDVARAYPISMVKLISTEIVNDTIADEPVVVTWCNLCQSAGVFVRPLAEDRKPLTFHIAGILWKQNMVMQDIETGSKWSQALGQCVEGPLVNTELRVVPSVVTTWLAWRKAYPQTTLLQLDQAPDRIDHWKRYPARSGATFALFPLGRTSPVEAWTLDRLRTERLIQETVDGVPVVVAWIVDTQTAVAYIAQLSDGTRLEFELRDGSLVDRGTQSRWNLLTGVAETGELQGWTLTRFPTTIAYREKWRTFETILGMKNRSNGRFDANLTPAIPEP